MIIVMDIPPTHHLNILMKKHKCSPSLGFGAGFHSGIFFTMASTAWPAAIRVSQLGLLR